MRNDYYEPVALGNDEDSDVAVRRLANGHAVLLPRSLRSLRGDALEIVADLQHVAVEMHNLQAQTAELVRDAREQGVSWEALGFCLGVTGQAVRKRWGSEEA